MSWQLLATILSPLVPLLIVIITLLYNKKNQLQRQLDGEKRRIFEDFIATLLKTFEDSKETDPNAIKANKKKLEESMMSIKKDLILYGSPRSIRAHNIWLAQKDKGNKANFTNVERFIRALRTEIGLSNNWLYLRRYGILQVMVNEDIAKSIK